MLESGLYKIFFVKQTEGDSEDRLVARVLVDKGQLYILEDYDHLLSDTLPEGKLDDTHQKVFWQLMHSGYYRIVHEDEVNQGFHEDLVDEMDLGQREPDAEYLLTGYKDEPIVMEMFQETAILDGKRLSPEELEDIMNRVRSGEFKLVPR